MSIDRSDSDVAADTPDADAATDCIIAAVLLLVENTDVLMDRGEFVVVAFAVVVLQVTAVDDVEIIEQVPVTSGGVVDKGVGESTFVNVAPVGILDVVEEAVIECTDDEGLATDVGVEQTAVIDDVRGGVVEEPGSTV